MHTLTVLGAADLGSVTAAHELTWEQLAAVFDKPVAKTKAEFPLVVGARFAVGARRTKATCESRNVVPIDIDGALHFDDALLRCAALGLTAIVHTTASHTPHAPRLRVFVALAAGVSAAQWDAGVKPWVRANWPEADTNALDIARVSYAPVTIAGYRCARADYGPPLVLSNAAPAVTQVRNETLADTDKCRRLVAVLAPCVPPIGHRHEFYLALTGFCAKQLLPVAACKALVIALCDASGADNKIAERLRLAEDTYAKHERGEQVAGETALLSTMAYAVGASAKSCVDHFARIAFGYPDKEEKEAPARSKRRIRDTAHRYPYPDGPGAGAEKVVRTTTNTLTTLLTTDPDWLGVWQHDIFSDRIFAVNPPFSLGVENGELINNDIHKVREWFAARGYRVTKEDTVDVIENAARKNPYHPVKEYLAECPAGKGAIDKVAKKALGAADSTTLRKFLIAACKRILHPGCQVDTVLVLVGKQGAKKTSFCRWLFGDWTKEDLSPLDSKQCVRELQGVWGVEIAELDKVLRAERDVVKSFVSRRFDSLDRKYQRERTVPRSCVMIGTTNQDDFLRDETGERRWWPMRSDAIDLSVLTDDLRDAMWGEAYAAALRNEQHWLTDDEEREISGEREQYRDYDPLEESLVTVLTKPLTLGEILTKLCLLSPALIREGGGYSEQRRVTKALHRIGATRRSDGRRRYWTIDDDVAPITKMLTRLS